MSMKRVYKCDICREEIKNTNFLFGLHFVDMKKFTLGGHVCTDGTHICYNCAAQLKEHLNSQEITKELNRREDANFKT